VPIGQAGPAGPAFQRKDLLKGRIFRLKKLDFSHTVAKCQFLL